MNQEEIVATALKSFTSGEYHYVFGEVYAPNLVDTDGESMTTEDIRKMAHDFIANGLVKALDTNHNHILSGAEVVESFIARKGDPDYAEGAWVLGVRMTDGELWEAIKAGEINSFSFDATVMKELSNDALPTYPNVMIGTTYAPVEQNGIPAHKHAFYLEIDGKGRVVLGKTSMAQGHSHEIWGMVTTEQTNGHSHRFAVEQMRQ